MKKYMKLGLLSLGVIGVLGACGNKESEKEEGVARVGILQYIDHESLDAARVGFIEELEASGYEEGKDLVVDYQNAQGDQANLKSMSERLVKEKNDLILTIATPATLSVASQTQDIPILFTAVTDAQSAGIINDNEKPGGNITGTSDLMPVDKQIDLLTSIVPDAKTIGIIYNSSEDNSVLQANLAKKELENKGITVKEATVTSTNDVQQALTSLAKHIDGLYVPTDNTLANTMETVGEVAKQYQIPVVAGAKKQVEVGGLATYGIDYNQLGHQTGKLAVKILNGEAKPGDLAVETSNDLSLIVNEDMANALGIDPKSIKMND